jgi:uncharacterized membrane protein YczE
MIKTMKNIEKILKSYLFYIISSFGISLTIKANVGVSSFNSMNLAISNASNIKVGTVTTVFNILFLIAYMYITKFSYKKKYLIQLISVMMFGVFINFFTYTVMGNFQIENYILRLIMITSGTTIGGFAVGMIVSYNAITFPIENLCLEIAKNTRFTFVKLRYFIDIISVTISIIISITYNLPLYVREGTIISLILLSSAMNFTKNLRERKISGSTQ